LSHRHNTSTTATTTPPTPTPTTTNTQPPEEDDSTIGTLLREIKPIPEIDLEEELALMAGVVHWSITPTSSPSPSLIIEPDVLDCTPTGQVDMNDLEFDSKTPTISVSATMTATSTSTPTSSRSHSSSVSPTPTPSEEIESVTEIGNAEVEMN
jgi:hypothetical protein